LIYYLISYFSYILNYFFNYWIVSLIHWFSYKSLIDGLRSGSLHNNLSISSISWSPYIFFYMIGYSFTILWTTFYNNQYKIHECYFHWMVSTIESIHTVDIQSSKYHFYNCNTYLNIFQDWYRKEFLMMFRLDHQFYLIS